MANIFNYVSYPETGYFSHLVNDYVTNSPSITAFYGFAPDTDGVNAAIAERDKYPINRKVLVDALNEQYKDLTVDPKTVANISSLLQENTFTICTAHQPNLLTGYLYFIYKILHAIKLAEQLNEQHPDKHFVPIYYMGSEDNDIEELGTFRFRGNKYVWDGDGQMGAVGRMNTAGLKSLLNDVFRLFGPPGKNCDDLQKMITTAYLKHKTVAEATHYLVNELFGRYGLVVLNPDVAALKATFIPVMEDELLHQNAHVVINKQLELLGANYKIQAQPREINLFYLADQVRERIEKSGDNWITVDDKKQWTKAELLDELKDHPERFSPNVMLRGLYQETILPNVAFIGGGAEVAYWLQLKTVFNHYHVFYPAILLRQSVLWIDEINAKARHQMGLNIHEIFKPEQQLEREYVLKHSTDDWQTVKEIKAVEDVFQSLEKKAAIVDPTLGPATDAVLTKMRHQLVTLEKKMLRAEKKKMEIQLKKVAKLKSMLFPNNGLQERVENFSEYYLQCGPAFLDIVKDGIDPLGAKFLVIE